MSPIRSKEVSSILSSYNIGSLKSFNPLCGCVENINLEVFTDQGHYVIRIHQDHKVLRTKDYVSFELGLLDYLKKKGFPVPDVIRARDKSRVFDFKGTHGVIFSFEEGKHLLPKSDWQAREVGKVLGLFHVLTECARFKGIRVRKSAGKEKIMGYISENIHILEKIDQRLAERLVQFASSLRMSFVDSLPSGYIHADLHAGNILFRNKTVSAVLDWDDSTKGSMVFDLANAIEAWCFPGRKLNLKRAKALIQGYQSHRRLNIAEKRLLWRCFFPILLMHSSYLLQPRFLKRDDMIDEIGYHMDFLDAVSDLGETRFTRRLFGDV